MTSPVTNWQTAVINGKNYLVIDLAKFYIPLDWDPSSNMFLAVAAPDGGLGNFQALVRGQTGATPVLDEVVDFTPLDPDDPTPDSMEWVTVGTNAYQLKAALHKGQTGASGTSTLSVGAYGTPQSKDFLIVNPTLDGFLYQAQKVGDRYLPTTILSMPSGNAQFTLTQVPVPPQRFDWRPNCRAYSILTGVGPNCAYDLVARLNSNDTSGADVGRGPGIGGLGPYVQTLVSVPPPASVDAYDRIAAGVGPTTIYFREERQTGSDTATTQATTTRVSVRPDPIP